MIKKINLSVTGCMGKMGQQLIKSSKNNKKFKLVSLTENKIINKKISGVKPGLNNIESFKNTNVIIDFTVPKCTLDVLKIASKSDSQNGLGAINKYSHIETNPFKPVNCLPTATSENP